MSKCTLMIHGTPITITDIILLHRALSEYDEVIIFLENDVSVITPRHAAAIFSLCTSDEQWAKVKVIVKDQDHRNFTQVPDEIKGMPVLTTNLEVYANCMMLGLETKLYREMIGYHPIYLREAYLKSVSYHNMLENLK